MKDGIEVHVSVRADMSEFSTWRPERISAFFQGIAQVIAAAKTIEKPQPSSSTTTTPPGRNAKPKPGED